MKNIDREIYKLTLLLISSRKAESPKPRDTVYESKIWERETYNTVRKYCKELKKKKIAEPPIVQVVIAILILLNIIFISFIIYFFYLSNCLY